jgi:uncharacterized protein YecT (DUF1311 family)
MQTSFLLRQPLALRTAMNIDRVPAWLWIALQTAAPWAAWRWLAGDPLGVLALAAPSALLWRSRGLLRAAPRLPWLGAALGGTLAASALHGLLAPPAASLLAAAAWACGLLAFLPGGPRRPLIANTFQNRVLGKSLFGAAMLACALWSASAQGASFDCGAARAPLEKAICADLELSALDDQLADAYRAALKKQAGSGSQLRGQQRRWLKSRAGDLDPDALKSAYRARVSYLEVLAAPAQIGAEFRFEKISKQRDFVLRTLICPKWADCATPAQLLVYNKGQSRPFQTINLENVGNVEMIDENFIEAGDFNFDGQDDFGIPTGVQEDYPYAQAYDIYLFNPKTGRYVYNKDLSDVTAGPSDGFFKVDAKSKRIISIGSCRNGVCASDITYRLENNRLIAVRKHTEDSISDPHGRLQITEETLVNGKWRRKITYSAIPADERRTLMELYDSTHGDGWARSDWKNAGRFRAPGAECEWHGITCDTQNGATWVVAIDLSENRLAGALPDLSSLTGLKELILRKNRLAGEILWLADMKSLKKLDISQNRLTGEIPALDEMGDLTMIDLSGNQLEGSIPPLAGLKKLETFDASRNQLTGEIPPLQGLTELAVFDVSHNRLTGSIPSLDGLPKLSQFRVGDNLLFGVPPAAPPRLSPYSGSSSLCPNHLSGPSPTDARWRPATAYGSSWADGCTPAPDAKR